MFRVQVLGFKGVGFGVKVLRLRVEGAGDFLKICCLLLGVSM